MANPLKNKIPGPPLRHAVRNLIEFRRRPMEFMKDLQNQFGDLVELRLGPKLFYFAYHPDHAKHVLTDNASNYIKNSLVFREIRPITGKTGLVQLDGPIWTKYRRLTNQIFQPRMMQSYIPLISSEVEKLCETWKTNSQEKVDVAQAMTALVLNTAGKLFFGVNIHKEAPPLGLAFLKANSSIGFILELIE